MPNATRSVSPSMYCTSFGSMPSRSLSTCLNTVSCPWPWFLLPISNVTLPLGWKRISANSCPGDAAFSIGFAMPDAAQFSPPPALVAPARKPVPIRERQRLFLVRREIAAVVIQRQGGLVGDLLARDQVPRPQLDPIEPEFARRIVDQPLDHISRLGPSGAAIGCGAVRVRHYRQHRNVRRPDIVDAGQGPDIAERREQVALRRDIGADIGQCPDPQRQKPSLRIQSQLGVADVIARVLVGEHRLAAVAHPAHRPAQVFRGEQHEPVLRILPALCPEPAADIAGDDADAALRHLEDARRERLPHAVRVLHVGIQRVAVLAGVPDAQGAARLHEMRVDPADHVAALDDMRRLGKGGVGRSPVAGLEQVRDVVGAFVPDRNFPFGSLRRIGHRGQNFVIDIDQLGGVARLRGGLGDDERDRLADIAHPPFGQPAMRPPEHRRPVRPLPLERHPHRAEPGRRQILAGIDRQHRRRRPRRRQVDRPDARVGVRRAQHKAVRLSRQADIVLKPPEPGQQPLVLEAPHRLPDPELAHFRSIRLRELCAGLDHSEAHARTSPPDRRRRAPLSMRRCRRKGGSRPSPG